MTIPRIIHRIWLGPDDPMPEAFQRYGDRWRELHPDWEVIDWTDRDLLPLLDMQALFDQAASLYPKDWKRFEADLLRLELLKAYGGVYVDTDAEPLCPIDDLLADQECVVGLSPQSIRGVHPITNAFMASEPDHPWIRALIRRVPAAVRQYRRRPLAQCVGPWHLTRVYRADVSWRGQVTVLGDGELYGVWIRHLWHNAMRKRGEGLG